MKKRTILALGVLTALTVLLLGFSGVKADPSTLHIVPNHGYCMPPSGQNPACNADQNGCNYCCNTVGSQYLFIRDYYGCGCCRPPEF